MIHTMLHANNKDQRYFVVISILLMMVLFSLWAGLKPAGAYAQVSAPAFVTVFGGSAVLEDVISDLKGSVFSAIQNAEISADRQVQHVANEALIVLREAEIAFSGQLDKTLSKVDAQVLSVIESIYITVEAIKQGEAELISAIDGAVLDVERIVGNTIFANYPFLLKRVVGLNHLYKNEGEYTIELRGSGFGSSAATLKKISVDGGNLLEKARINNISQHAIRVSFDVATLNPLFDTNGAVNKRKIKVLPVDLEFERVIKQPWYLFFLEDKLEQLAHQFYAYFIPNYAGELQLVHLGEQFAWQLIDDFAFNHRSASNHCSSDCDDHKSFPCGTHRCPSDEQVCVGQSQGTPLREGDERLLNARWSGNGGYHDSFRAEVRNNASCLYFYVRSGTHSHTFRVYANREKYLKQPGLASLGDESIPVEFGKTYTVAAPKHTRLTNYSLDIIGSTLPVTGELRQGVNNEVIRVLSTSEIGGNTVHNLTIKYPAMN